jgi:citrate synthase
MSLLADKLESLLPSWRDERRRLVADFGGQSIGAVTVARLLSGMRGVHALVCDTSNVDPHAGLIIRSRPVGQLSGLLPEEVFWLLLTGDEPSELELAGLRSELARRSTPPSYIADLVASLPESMQPMAVIAALISALQRESRHALHYNSSSRDELWKHALEDSLRLLALAPLLAAAAYHRRMPAALPLPHSDMAQRFVTYLELDDAAEATEMMRLFLVLHSDHESGNVSALSALTVSSAHSSAFYAVAAGLCGLAGPIHGHASTGSVEFLSAMSQSLAGNVTADSVREYCREWLVAGRLLPGYGHAVLRGPDPRFTALHRFGMQHFPDDELFKLCDLASQVVPELLREQGRAANPYPNVDGITGTVLKHYGVGNPQYYSVVFGLGLLIGMLAQYVLNRALLHPLVRPRSVTMRELRELDA